MRKAAKITGWVAFVVTSLGVGAISLALLSIGGPLADGSHAAGAEPRAYAVVLGLVAVGASGVGLLLAVLVEAFGRIRDQ
jgi:hypothetical protein